jgi:hypothetical protein
MSEGWCSHDNSTMIVIKPLLRPLWKLPVIGTLMSCGRDSNDLRRLRAWDRKSTRLMGI